MKRSRHCNKIPSSWHGLSQRMTSIAPSNRLADCLSPYLRQHAGNPVNWQPWDDEALALAKNSDVPVLLSIGYSACHWCHVMEEESFSDEKIAARMNEAFVCVKVDREERPDLDKTYQLAHYLLSRSTGGWPLTVFLTPEQVPFFSGTYFPPQPRGGMMSFPDLLDRVKEAWDTQRDAIDQQNEKIVKALNDVDAQSGAGNLPGTDVGKKCAVQTANNFDLENGGLGLAPKFPQTPNLRFATVALARGEEDLRGGLSLTMEAMASGGLHDHVGGGFFRYCVDPVWNIPHFEKMLIDNAQLLELYAMASVVLQKPAYGFVAQRTADWLLSEMRLDGGGFATAIDADSEGEEGKYYVWAKEELDGVLDAGMREALSSCYNVAGPANFEGNKIHLHQGIGNGFRDPGDEAQHALAVLKEARDARTRPHVDDKVLASNCGLAAHALARAGLMLNEPSWIQAARDAVGFVDREMVAGGVMRTAWRDGKCSDIPAFLDDHAYMLLARLSLLADGCGQDDLDGATKAADAIIDLFDDGSGGLLFSAKDAPRTIRKIRSSEDGPAPSGNGVAVSCLLALGWITGRTEYLGHAEKVMAGFSGLLDQAPGHAPTMALAVDDFYKTPAVVTLAGPAEVIEKWRRELALEQAQGVIVLCQPSKDVAPELAKAWPDEKDEVLATVCRGNVCQQPTADLAGLRRELSPARG